MKTLALTLVVGAVVALGYAEVMPLIESPVLSLDSAVSVLLVVVVAVLGFYVLRPVVAQRPPEIRSGVLSLEYPIPRTNGSRTRTVALDEVAEVEPAIEGGHPGGTRGGRPRASAVRTCRSRSVPDQRQVVSRIGLF